MAARKNSLWHAPLLALAVALIGCGGGVEPGSSAVSDLIREDGGLPLLEEATVSGAWWLAPPGCEGLLYDDVLMTIASLEHGLLAAVDPTGHIVCVDTVEAVGAELDELGRHDDAVNLSDRFARAEGLTRPPSEINISRSRFGGDPNPEPNDCVACGDLNPEPNMGPTTPDPSGPNQ